MKRARIDEDCSHIGKKTRVTEEARFLFFEDLPDELLELILTMIYNSKNARFVCRKWLGIVSNYSFLKTLCLQRWGEDSKLVKYERSSQEKKAKIIEKYFIPLVKDENESSKVDWNRYYKIRSNYEKFLWLECLTQSSELKKAKLKNIIGRIHMGDIEKYPEVGYRALKLLCDLARMYIEDDNISATECFVVQTWGYSEPRTDERAKYNTKMCACLFKLYYIAKHKGITQLQVSLILKITNRFVVSSFDPTTLVKLMKELSCSEPKILHDLQSWYAAACNNNVTATDEPGINLALRTKQAKYALFEATKRLFNDYTAKQKAVRTGLEIAEKKDPEFNSKLFRLVADLASKNEKFEEESSPLLAKLAMEFPELVTDEEYKCLLEVALRRQKILLSDPIQQFYVASALLDSLNEHRVQFYNEDDLRLLHKAIIGYNLREIESNDETKYKVRLLPRLLVFGDRLIPYMSQYDRFFLEGQTHNPALAAFYLCDILGKLCPDVAVQKITSLIEQRTFQNLGGIIAEGYDKIKAMLGDLWTTKYDEIIIELLLDLFPEEKANQITLKKRKVDKKAVKGRWIFPIKDVPELHMPWVTATASQYKAMPLLIEYAKSHPMDRSVQIRILNIVLIYRMSSTQKEFIESFLAMPIFHGEDIDDIVPQMFATITYNSLYSSEILLRLVNLHPCAVLIRLKQNNISGMNSIFNSAIIGCYYGILTVNSRLSKDAQLATVRQALLNKENPISPKLHNILLHYAIQLRCAIFDSVSTSYSTYRERDYWSLIKPALKDPGVREFIQQFMDEYDPETNFMKDMIPQYEKKKNKKTVEQ